MPQSMLDLPVQRPGPDISGGGGQGVWATMGRHRGGRLGRFARLLALSAVGCALNAVADRDHRRRLPDQWGMQVDGGIGPDTKSQNIHGKGRGVCFTRHPRMSAVVTQ